MDKQPLEIYNELRIILKKKYEIMDRLITIKVTIRKLNDELKAIENKEKDIVRNDLI